MTLLFIFDMDDVLYDYNWRQRMASLTVVTGYPLEELRRRWWNDEGEWAAEAGAYRTASEYLSAASAALGMPMDEDEWIRARGAAMSVRPESLAAVRRASELGTITLLTNNGALISHHLRVLAPELIPLFGEHLFTSSDYGARKPNPVVFERVLARYGVAAENAFFADDMDINVRGAESVGITGYHYGSAHGMHQAIDRFAASRRDAASTSATLPPIN